MIREATPTEITLLGIELMKGAESWVAVYEDSTIEGHIALTWGNGVCFGHSTKCWSKDKFAALKLWRTAKAKAKSLGFDKVTVHIPPGSTMRMFWENRGFKEVCVVMQGEI